MSYEDYLILTKGRAACLILDSAIGLLDEMEITIPSAESARQECMTELFYIITRVASFSCGKEKWTEVYNFLVEIGISIPEDFHLEMSYEFDKMPLNAVKTHQGRLRRIALGKCICLIVR